MSFFIDDGSTVATHITAPEGRLEFSYRPATTAEIKNWLWHRDRLAQGDVDVEFVTKHLVTLNNARPTAKDVARLKLHLFRRVLDAITGDDPGDVDAPSPDAALGN